MHGTTSRARAGPRRRHARSRRGARRRHGPGDAAASRYPPPTATEAAAYAPGTVQSQCNGAFSDGARITLANPVFPNDVPGQQIFRATGAATE